MSIRRVGFIGLGAMGVHLARHLLDGGFELTLWARREGVTDALAAAGAQVAASPAALAGQVDAVVLCVTDTAAVEDVVFGPGGVAAVLGPGQLVIDHSTIDPLATRDFAARIAAAGAAWVDAPVTGGIAGAEAGRLVIMAGGAADAIAAAHPLLDCYAARVTAMGAPGTGQASKIVNQMLIGAHVAVVAEAFNYAASFGVEASHLPDALAGGWADSAVLQNHARRMAAAAYPDNVPARLMLKDLDIATDLGRATDSPMPVTALVQQLYRRLVAEGHDDKGQIGLMHLYRGDQRL